MKIDAAMMSVYQKLIVESSSSLTLGASFKVHLQGKPYLILNNITCHVPDKEDIRQDQTALNLYYVPSMTTLANKKFIHLVQIYEFKI